MTNFQNAFGSFAVNDLGKTKTFYGELLGLKIIKNDMGLMELYTAVNKPIMIYPKEDHSAASFTILNFLVPDIESAVDDLTEKGIAFEQYDGTTKTNEKGICRNEHGPAIAWFKDPSGNILSLIEEQQPI
jgi:predicted enzyme related to lactoylglutathione lyase